MSQTILEDNPDLAEIRRHVLSGLQEYSAKIYLFGSWATGDQRRTSDVDVAVLSDEPIPSWVLSQIRLALEESRILPHVDLIDLSITDHHFRNRVVQDGIPWND